MVRKIFGTFAGIVVAMLVVGAMDYVSRMVVPGVASAGDFAAVPTKAKMHTLCICADASDNLAMTIRTALDTAAQLALLIDANH